MKSLKMFELRDSLIVLHLNSVAELLLNSTNENEVINENNVHLSQENVLELFRSVSNFSYDVLAAKTKFKDNKCAEVIVLVFQYVLKHHEKQAC